MFQSACRVRIKYSQSTFISVIHLSSKRDEEVIQGASSTRTWASCVISLLPPFAWISERSTESHIDGAGVDRKEPALLSLEKGRLSHDFIACKYTEDGFQLLWICWEGSEEVDSQLSLRNFGRRHMSLLTLTRAAEDLFFITKSFLFSLGLDKWTSQIPPQSSQPHLAVILLKEMSGKDKVSSGTHRAPLPRTRLTVEAKHPVQPDPCPGAATQNELSTLLKSSQ